MGGSFAITGALEELYIKSKVINDDRTLLRPFPQGSENEEIKTKLWTTYVYDDITENMEQLIEAAIEESGTY